MTWVFFKLLEVTTKFSHILRWEWISKVETNIQSHKYLENTLSGSNLWTGLAYIGIRGLKKLMGRWAKAGFLQTAVIYYYRPCNCPLRHASLFLSLHNVSELLWVGVESNVDDLYLIISACVCFISAWTKFSCT